MLMVEVPLLLRCVLVPLLLRCFLVPLLLRCVLVQVVKLLAVPLLSLSPVLIFVDDCCHLLRQLLKFEMLY